jgi:hypothetical protein
MAEKATVTRVNEELRKELSEAIGHRENPRLITVIKSLVRLTNTETQNAEMDKAEPPKPVCPHEIVNRKTGKCVACGEVPEED